jgi:hypothetical protein
MSTVIELNPNEVPSIFKQAFPDYNGRRYRVLVTSTVNLTDNYWDGGSKSDYIGLDIVSGTSSTANPAAFGWFLAPKVPTITLEPGQAVIEHTQFCGKDMGIRIHLHPDNVRKLLPAPADLTEMERIVLYFTRSRKPGYGGDKDYRFHEAQRETGLLRDGWIRGAFLCTQKGLLDNRGAITVAGRNAISSMRHCGYPKPTEAVA